MTQNVIVMDIDGCCIDSEARLPLLIDGQWDAWSNAWQSDKPIRQGVEVYSSFMKNLDYRPIFITSRAYTERERTMDTLNQVFGNQLMKRVPLLMRNNTFTEGPTLHVPEEDIKPFLLEEAGYSIAEVFMAFDDRDCVVRGWRKRGVVCYQTNYGDF